MFRLSRYLFLCLPRKGTWPLRDIIIYTRNTGRPVKNGTIGEPVSVKIAIDTRLYIEPCQVILRLNIYLIIVFFIITN